MTRLYREQKHLPLLATQTRNQSRRRGSSIGDTLGSPAWFQRGSETRISSTSPVVVHTAQHTPLLTVKLYLAGEEIEAVVETGASVSAVGKRLARKVEIWKQVRKVKVRQGDGRSL